MKSTSEEFAGRPYRGDEVYVRHPEKGVVHGRVSAVGEHGFHLATDGGTVKVRHGAVLGYRKRAERKLRMIDSGEDGCVMEDEAGRRTFVRTGKPEPMGEDMPLGKALLLNVTGLSECCTNHGLESMAKAMSEGDDGIWAPHESPFIRGLIERFTERGLLALDTVRTELQRFLAGEGYTGERSVVSVPAGFMGRWTDKELDIVRLYLESLPVDQFTLDDYGLLVDFLVQRYLPMDVLRTETEAFVVKAAMMGRVEANLRDIDEARAAMIEARLPENQQDAEAAFNPSRYQALAMDFARVHACEQVVDLTEGARHRLRQTVITHAAGRASGSLEQALSDDFATLNRDWRRIAVTEAGEAANHGLITGLMPGTKVQRLEVYPTACNFCKKIHGITMTVVEPDAEEKDWDTQVWAGKTNIGRSGAPRKRVGDELIERTPAELWTVPAGLVHPHCRGRWHVVQEPPTGRGVDPDFAKWMEENL